MNPFSLVCKSCAAKLKVTKLSAIGQTLGCPKCGTMVRVQPPEDWKPPAGIGRDGRPLDQTSDTLGSFEDIDQILTDPDSPSRQSAKTALPSPSIKTSPPNRSKPSGESARRRQKPDARQNTAASQADQPGKHVAAPVAEPANLSGPKSRMAPSDPMTADRPREPNKPQSASRPGAQETMAPVLPGSEWTSEASRKKNQLLLMITGASGVLICVAAIIAWIVVSSGAGDPVPNQDQVAQQEDLATRDSADSKDASSTAEEPNSKSEDPGTGMLDVAPTDVKPINQAGAIGAAPQVPIQDDVFSAPKAAGGKGGSGSNGGNAGTSQSGRPLPLSPGSASSGAPTVSVDPAIDPTPEFDPSKPVSDVVKTEQEMGDLASLLAFANTSLQDLEGAAVNLNENKFGLTKYFIEPEKGVELNPQRRIELVIAELSYQKPVPLSQVVRTIAAISGVAITIDARQLAVMGKPIDPMIAPEIKGLSVVEALTQVGASQELKPRLTETGVILTLDANDELIESRIEFPRVPGIDDQGRARFINAIKVLIAPGEWLDESNPSTITLNADTISLRCTRSTKKLIQQFVDKLNASAELLERPDDPEALRQVTSRWASTEALREQSPGVKAGIDQRLGQRFNQLRRQVGLSVLVDWQSVMKQGWTPLTRLPGELVEPSTEVYLREIARAMRLSLVAIDAQTMVLTTDQQARSWIDLEVYPIGQRLAAQVQKDTLRDLVYNLLGVQVQDNFVRVIYEPRCQCLIVVANQGIQKQVERLIRRIDSTQSTPDPDK